MKLRSAFFKIVPYNLEPTESVVDVVIKHDDMPPNPPNKVDDPGEPLKLEVGKFYEVAEPHFVFANGFKTTVEIIEMQIDPDTGRKRFRSEEDFWYDEDGYYRNPRDQDIPDFYCLVREVQKRGTGD
ncbi:hypothetical protein ACN9ML_01460 [Dyadobacter endophyticus]|uniref:hypothetical protein n=1 Tax=Dyadobacter TaxID=120831 RepID=UPI003CE8FD99